MPSLPREDMQVPCKKKEKHVTIVTGDVMSELKKQLDWRGPTSGKRQGHVVLSYDYGEFLYRRVLDLIATQDALVKDLERKDKT